MKKNKSNLLENINCPICKAENYRILKMSINPCKLFLMMTRKSCQNYHFNRMFNFV